MSEKVSLLPTAPADFAPGTQLASGSSQVPPPNPEQYAVPMPRLIITPGLEFDPARKYRYGMSALISGVLLLASFILVEMRDCNWGPGIDLDRLQSLHISLMVFALVLYLLSLFGIADYIFQFKLFFLFGVLLLYTFAGLMIWMTYEAATNPCVKVFNTVPIDTAVGSNKNVFSRGDAVGIVVFLSDLFGTIFMFSAASNFYKRY